MEKNNINIILVITLLAIIAFGVFFVAPRPVNLGSSYDNVDVSDGINNTNVTLNQYVPTLVSATSTNRLDITMCNTANDGTTTQYVSFVSGPGSVTATKGYVLFSKECRRMTDLLGYRYLGNIYAMSTSSTSTMSFIEK